jgi:deoxyribodipyrimidine photo-lyase
MSIAIVWFRQDLRLADNPALRAALDSGSRVLPIWIDEPGERNASAIGAACRVWLHHSLERLGNELAARGSQLVFAQGEALPILESLIESIAATGLYWNRRYDPESIAIDKAIKARFGELSPATFKGSLVYEPWEVLKGDGTPYRVFTPYWRQVAARLDADGLSKPLAAPATLEPWIDAAGNLDEGRWHSDVNALELVPDLDWPSTLMQGWHVGEAAAKTRLVTFLKQGGASTYKDLRDLPGRDGTSMLSPALHHGELSPRQILHRVLGNRRVEDLDEGETTFAKEVVWREFAHAMLYHFPHTLDQPLDRRFERFVWADDQDAVFSAWCCGQTGVPIVDAGMRQLYATGWMHNRVRMVVASFLVKNLLVPWQRGEAWFRDTLVDADAASNTFGWQWAAGCGADAAPYFRVFNPVLQGEKFDREGDYVKRWVPELAGLGKRHIHAPWTLPESESAALDYPAPLVDLKQSRQRALDAFAALKTV